MFRLFTRRRQQQLRDSVEIRMEAIGGQGAHSAGKMLAEAAVLGMGFNGHHFSSFGSEKRGSPVKSFVRFRRDGKPVRSSAPITDPDLLVVFHENLLTSHPEILGGLTGKETLLINSPKAPSELTFPTGTRLKQVATVDALRIAARERCGLNAALLGAVSPLCPEISPEAIERALLAYLRKLPEEQRESNRRGFREGSKKVRVDPFFAAQSTTLPKPQALPRLGWANAPIGGLIVNPGNTALRDMSASRRGTLPLLKPELCVHCGFCDMACPDYCFVWQPSSASDPNPRLLGIDYRYCKGCEKCIVACPMGALVVARETPELVAANRQARFPQLGTVPSLDPSWLTRVAETRTGEIALQLASDESDSPRGRNDDPKS